MGPAMAAVTHSEATAAPVAAEPERRSASAATPRDTVLWMQRNAGNAAVARAVARPARAIQRCGANCGCTSCSSGHAAEDEMMEEQFGLLRTAVARRTA
jgi:hypothetical protein